jgi:hypothetical protein
MSHDNTVVTSPTNYEEKLAHGHESNQNRSTKVAWKFIFFIHVPNNYW